MKRIMIKTAVLTVALILAATTTVYAQQYSPDVDFEAVNSGNGVEIIEYAGPGGAISIPPRIGGRPVVSIGKSAFSTRNNITSVIIPEGVTEIKDDAFSANATLESVTLPRSLTTIGVSAFRSTSLKSITIPSNVTSIGNRAFQNTSLISITIPSNVTSIGERVFQDCSQLTSVTIQRPSTGTTFSGTRIGTNAFNNTPNANIRVPANSVNAYKAAANWSAWADKIAAQ